MGAWRPGCPERATTDENVELLHSLIMCDRRNMCDISRQLGRRFGAVPFILIDSLEMAKGSAKWVHRMWTKDQKNCKLDISKYLLSLYEVTLEEFMHQDETWVHHFDPEAKKQIMLWKHTGSPS